MPYIESAKDIFYIVLAFGILWIVVFLSWLLYYFITILRQVNDMVKDVRSKLQLVESSVVTVRERVEKSSNYLYVIAEGVKQGLSFFLKRKFDIDEDPRKNKKK